MFFSVVPPASNYALGEERLICEDSSLPFLFQYIFRPCSFGFALSLIWMVVEFDSSHGLFENAEGWPIMTSNIATMSFEVIYIFISHCTNHPTKSETKRSLWTTKELLLRPWPTAKLSSRFCDLLLCLLHKTNTCPWLCFHLLSATFHSWYKKVKHNSS